jgi:hypothetical protein
MAELVTPQLDLREMRLLPIKDKGMLRQIGIVTLRGRPLQPAAQAFVKLLRPSCLDQGRQCPDRKPSMKFPTIGRQAGTPSLVLGPLAPSW